MDSQVRLHQLLNYLLTKITVTGKLRPKTTFRFPYKELAANVGKTTNRDVDLVLTISMEWDETRENPDYEFESEFED